MYLERITWGWSRQVGGRRAAAIPVAAGLGAHQPDWRLRLAAEPQAGGREVQAATIARKTLAYDFFRIQRAPPPGGLTSLDLALPLRQERVSRSAAASIP